MATRDEARQEREEEDPQLRIEKVGRESRSLAGSKDAGAARCNSGIGAKTTRADGLCSQNDEVSRTNDAQDVAAELAGPCESGESKCGRCHQGRQSSEDTADAAYGTSSVASKQASHDDERVRSGQE